MFYIHNTLLNQSNIENQAKAQGTADMGGAIGSILGSFSNTEAKPTVSSGLGSASGTAKLTGSYDWGYPTDKQFMI